MASEPEVEHVQDRSATPEGVVALLRGLTRLIQDFLHERARAAGLNSTEFIALIRIADSDGMTGAQLGIDGSIRDAANRPATARRRRATKSE